MDVGASIVGAHPAVATLYCKRVSNNGIVLAGIPIVNCIFTNILNCSVNWLYSEGQTVHVTAQQKRVAVATVSGPCNQLLQGERIALNLLSHASAIATASRQVVTQAETLGFKGQIAGTRKTTPGFRLVEKYALIVGGASPHRYDVSQMCMLKDNHIDACKGDIEECVKRARSLGGFSLMIEVECRSKQDAERAIAAGAHVIMLDNFDPVTMKQVAQQLKQAHPHVLLEVSGGIGAHNLHEYVCDFIDIVSMGTLTQDIDAVDFSLKINNN